MDQALAAIRGGDTLVVPKPGRLARSVPDARAIGDNLAARDIKLSLGGQVYDPDDPMGKMFFNILATFAEFETDLLRMRTREGMAVARAKASCAAGSRNCPPGSNASWCGWPAPASSPSPTSPRCSPSPARPCTAPSSEPRSRTGAVTNPARYLALGESIGSPRHQPRAPSHRSTAPWPGNNQIRSIAKPTPAWMKARSA